ncbi:hypothetical protein L1987_83626 [Smallanthus sonchifolius]|uniref:Uncharacterized protein n=1 Tax=Smallanthus sonchifolius TaxID=185202 RepID=A0ACB8YD41_9ASTR|nr:hypothetical protein L1987_83626 [Smallanthus sonchifolius]
MSPFASEIHSLHINCGGEELYINNTKYEADRENKGALQYYNAGNWAFSRTGMFKDRIDPDAYIFSNTSNISTFDTGLYTTARRSAISLTYYGLCLMNSNYTVKLHFAEIFFTQYKSLNITGRRVFDVYVQLFNAAYGYNNRDEGIGVPVIKSYLVNVKNNTAKIQLYWAGKGTTNIPFQETYGPVISAISVDPNFKPPSFGKKIQVGITVGIPCGLVVAFLVGVCIWRFRIKHRAARELTVQDLEEGIIPIKKIKNATKNFDPSNKIGEGGFGAVYKGLLSDGTYIAVKQLSSKSKQGTHEFLTEISMLSALQHPNLVKLHGCCVEGHQFSLIYEYMENNCLSRALFGYLAPEYQHGGDKTSAADVYSFGIVLLEIVTGKRNGETIEDGRNLYFSCLLEKMERSLQPSTAKNLDGEPILTSDEEVRIQTSDDESSVTEL